jgi:tetratricopeptide (TPR) repeat protein
MIPKGDLVALTERLQILVTADGKGAVNEFSRIGATAERELGRTDDRVKKLSAGLVSGGTQIALAGGIATAGVFALAQAAGDYEEAASAAGVIFGDSAEAVEDFGKSALDSAGLSRRAAVEAANTFGTFGKAAGLAGDDLAKFSTDLTQLAGDLASFKNTSTEEAITAIGAALRGESEPIRKYGVLLDDATLKAKAMELGIYDGVGALDQQAKVLAAQAEIFEQTTDAQGDFGRTQDSLSNQTRSFAAQIENLKIGLGEGAVPVFSELVGAANDVLGAFQNLSPETQNFIGRVGAIGAVGATAVGGLSVLVGGALRAVDTFRDLGSRMQDAQGNMTRTGRAASAMGKVVGGAVAVGGVYLLADALFRLTRDAGASEAALNRLRLDIPQGNVELTLSRLNALGESYKSLGDVLFQPLSDNVVVGLDGYGASIANVERAIAQLIEGGNIQEARAALETLGAVKLLPENADVLPDLNNILEVYGSRLDDAGAAAQGADRSLSGFTGGIDRYRNGIDEAADSTADFSESLDSANKLIKLSGDMFKLSADRAKSFLGAIENSSAIDDLLGATLDLSDSTEALIDGMGALTQVNFEEVASGFGYISDEAVEALRDVLAVGEDAQAAIAAALQFQGAEAAVAKADQIRAGLVDVLEAAGVADDQVQYLLESIGLTPEQVETAIVVSGTDEAIAKLTLLRDFYTNADGTSGIPDEINTQVGVAIAEGRFVDAANLIELWVKDQEDGSIEDPLLIAMGLGDTQPASDEVDKWKNDEESKPPARIPVGANTDPARIDVGRLYQDIGKLNPRVTIDLRLSDEGRRLLQSVGGTAAFGAAGPGGNGYNPYTGQPIRRPNRAVGGPVDAGMPYWVNEPALGGELFRPSTDGFVMSAADTDRLISGLERLLSGGGNALTVQQNIIAPDPLTAASESARKLRDASYLVGA